jgi:hypothetical protein
LSLSALALVVVAFISLYQKIYNKNFRKEFKKNGKRKFYEVGQIF